MRKIILAIALACVMHSLCALQVVSSTGKITDISYTSLQKEEMQSFSTQRKKNGKDITDKWQGIPLLSWLSKQGFEDWHSLKSVSYDGFEVILHRVELDAMPAFLALVQDGNILAESELRLIYPDTRESLWLRGVKSLHLQGFTPIPFPKQIFIWEDSFSAMAKENPKISLQDLMQHSFHQNKGTVVLVDAELHCLALEYPQHLQKAWINIAADGTQGLEGLSLMGNMQPKELVYMQCGPYAYIKKGELNRLNKLADVLGWDWEKLGKYEVRSETRQLPPDSLKLDDGIDTWIELK
ncbi:MAG: hypothetical protein PHO32_05295 [Candidatus Cloacimonetes bacterium]|nr:hypothetical protein [Candidatus Cloacimonadota bacterium]